MLFMLLVADSKFYVERGGIRWRGHEAPQAVLPGKGREILPAHPEAAVQTWRETSCGRAGRSCADQSRRGAGLQVPGSCRETGGEYLGGFFRGVLTPVPERQIVPEYLQRGLDQRVGFSVWKSRVFGGVGNETSKGDEQFACPAVGL